MENNEVKKNKFNEKFESEAQKDEEEIMMWENEEVPKYERKEIYVKEIAEIEEARLRNEEETISMSGEYKELLKNRCFLEKGMESIGMIKKIGEKLDDIAGRKRYVDVHLEEVKRRKYEKGLQILREILEMNESDLKVIHREMRRMGKIKIWKILKLRKKGRNGRKVKD